MTPEALCTLAFRALEEPGFGEVLGDAIELAGWDDRRAAALVKIPDVRLDDGRTYVFRTSALALFAEGRRAVAAVLAFGGWPRRWPLAAEMWIWRRDFMAEWVTEFPSIARIRRVLAQARYVNARVTENVEEGRIRVDIGAGATGEDVRHVLWLLRDAIPAHAHLTVERRLPLERSRG